MKFLKALLSLELLVLQWNFLKIQYSTANSNSIPNLYFIFLDEKKFYNYHIWSTFFKDSPSLATVYVYRSNSDSRINFEIPAIHVSIDECKLTSLH